MRYLAIPLTLIVLLGAACGDDSGDAGSTGDPEPTETAAAPTSTATAAASSGDEPAPAGGAHETTISGFAFEPEIVVDAGSTVTWRNADSVGHDVASVDGLFESPLLGQGDEFTQRFEEPGTYEYQCRIHPYMTGAVVVE